jgi:hypothetical protein
MFLDVSRCFSMFLDVSRCFSMFFDVSRCFSMFLDVSRCFSMFFDVSQCFPMFPDQCSLTDALFCSPFFDRSLLVRNTNPCTAVCPVLTPVRRKVPPLAKEPKPPRATVPTNNPMSGPLPVSDSVCNECWMQC